MGGGEGKCCITRKTSPSQPCLGSSFVRGGLLLLAAARARRTEKRLEQRASFAGSLVHRRLVVWVGRNGGVGPEFFRLTTFIGSALLKV